MVELVSKDHNKKGCVDVWFSKMEHTRSVLRSRQCFENQLSIVSFYFDPKSKLLQKLNLSQISKAA